MLALSVATMLGALDNNLLVHVVLPPAVDRNYEYKFYICCGIEPGRSEPSLYILCLQINSSKEYIHFLCYLRKKKK